MTRKVSFYPRTTVLIFHRCRRPQLTIASGLLNQSRTKPALWTEVVLNPNPSLRDCPGHDAKAVWDRIYNGYRIQCIPLKRPTDDIWPSRLHGQIFWWSQMSPCIVIMLGYNQPDVLSETSAVCSYNRYGLWHGSYIRYRLY